MHDSRDNEGAVDLAAYFERIAYTERPAVDLQTLQALHLAHATHIPFENLDLMLGRPVHVDLPSIEAKLVRAGRGGYCFEQNLLFAAALRALGFDLDLLLARVRIAPSRVLPRSHMVLAVRLDGRVLLADVGFGAGGLLQAVPLDPPEALTISRWSWRVVREGPLYVMQCARIAVWRDLYAFSLEPQWPIDIVVANHYVSTHPDSRFLQVLAAQRMAPELRLSLRNHELTIDHGDALEMRRLTSKAEVLQTLDHEFGLRLPADAPLRIPED
jgi:N-hydroxyarylamine O-acetyltransferase